MVVEELKLFDNEWKIKLTKGIAIDRLGNDIIVPYADYYRIENADKILELKSTPERLGIFIVYDERTEVNVTDVTGENKCEKNIIEEDFKIFIDKIIPTSEPDIDNVETISESVDKSKVELVDEPDGNLANVFLVAIRFDASDGTIKVDEFETKKRKRFVASIPLIFDLLSSHIDNDKNPHNVDAKSLGALRSINNIPEIGSNYESNLELVSDSLKSTDHTSDPKLKKNQLKIDFKEQHYHTLTGLVRISYTGPEQQEFGPIDFKTKGFVIPPAIFIGKTEHDPDSGNFEKISYMDNDPDTGLEFKIKNITLKNFHIVLKNNLKKKTSEPVYLRYWIVPHYTGEQDLITFDSSVKRQLDVNPITESGHKLNIKLDLEQDEPVDLVLKTLGGQYKKFEFNQYSAAQPFFEIPISSISDVPGDIIDISLLNDPEISTSSKFSPKITMDKNEYFIDDDFTITIQDYEKKDKSTIDFVVAVDDIVVKQQAIKNNHDGTFTYSGNLNKIFYNLDATQRISLTIRYDFEFQNQKHQCAESTPIYYPEIIFDLPENFDWHEHLIKISVRNRYLSNQTTIPISIFGIKTDGTELDVQKFELRQISDGIFSDAYDLTWWLQASDLIQLEEIAYLKCIYEFEDNKNNTRRIVQQYSIQN